MRKVLEIGGLVAGAILIVFGVVAIVMGVNGRTTVSNAIKAEQIVGTPDMTPAAIKAELVEAARRLPELPSNPKLRPRIGGVLHSWPIRLAMVFACSNSLVGVMTRLQSPCERSSSR